MWQILLLFALFAAAMAAFKIAIILLVIAGLIFRTRETFGLLVIGTALNVLHNYPALAIGTVIVLLAFSWHVDSKRKRFGTPNKYRKALKNDATKP